VVGLGARRWAPAREPPPAGPPLEPAQERRLEHELRRFEG